MPREKSIAERFHDFVDRVGARLHKPNRRFLREAVFGLLERRSVLLSEIGRALEEPRRLIHTEKRLSRGLSSPRYDDAAVEQDYLDLVAPILRDERYRRPTIAVDLTDIAKSRARKMPYLARVRDGSEDELANGYEVISVEAVGVRCRRLPLLSRLFSSVDPEYKSQNAVILDAVATARRHVPDDAFWVFDAGFDSHLFFKRFNEMGLTFAVRLNFSNNRTLYTAEGKTDVESLVARLQRPHRHQTKHRGKGGGRVEVGWVHEVHLPHYTASGWCSKRQEPELYSVVVASGGILGQEPLALFTNMRVLTSDDAFHVVDAYLDRWGVEEAHRFTKQGFGLENVRALTWTGLKRMVQLVTLAYGFLATLVHGPRKQVEYLAASFKAFGPVPTYLYYRLLEGIGRVLRAEMDLGP